MRNIISAWLLGIGILLISICFILGLIVANAGYGGFDVVIALYWWFGGVVSGFFYIGMSEIVHLLQKILDKNGGSNVVVGAGTASYAVSPDAAPSVVASSDAADSPAGNEHYETKFKDLTILLENERFKGQLWVTNSSVKVMRKSMLQSDSDAELVMFIEKSNLSVEYERDDDYVVYRFQEGSSYKRLDFKTYNVYDYEKIVNLLNDRG